MNVYMKHAGSSYFSFLVCFIVPFIVKCSTANKNTAESQEKENYSVSSPRKHSSFKRKDSQKQEEMVDENVERRNQMVHGLTCSGLTETQYINSCQAAGIGHVEQQYISTVHSSLGYRDAVKSLYERKLLEARTEAQQDLQYFLHGDVIITDARHDSSRGSQHTTVSALSHSNKKVVYSLNWSKEDMSAAASREIPMTKQVIDSLAILGEAKKKKKLSPSWKGLPGYQVGEVAHDYVPGLKQWFSTKGIKNSYDSWHGGKGVKKAFKKVASGLVRDAEKSWFAELSDKVKCTKMHIYYAMKNCNGDADVLRNYIANIVDHYQGNHTKCHQDSRCKEDGYVCSKKPLVSERAIAAYRKAVEGTTVFKNAEDYGLCRDTYWIESLHLVMLIYTPKRIHFSRADTYEMRIQLAILDWNENLLREASSLQFYQTSRQPDRIAPHRVLTEKTYKFKEEIWEKFFSAL
ncbi:uncharacterized protein LOC141865606 [Acropora palmata]|uniref:uncharacterized protein LOC141865606 n=1 Tax=Acropora palmata TaxID=6131 RepID=UPI003DA1B138